MIKSGKSDKTKKSRAKRLRIFAAYLLVIGMAGSGVYADEPEVPERPSVQFHHSARARQGARSGKSRRRDAGDYRNNGGRLF